MRRLARHTATRLALVVLTALSTLAVLATPALATDVVLTSLRAVCSQGASGDGIAFSVGTDRTGDAATHPLIRVEWRPAGATDFALLGEGELSEDNGYVYSDTVEGLDLEGIDEVVVRATAVSAGNGGADWGDGRPAGDSYTSRLDVSSCTDEVDGESARVSWTAGCRSDGIPAALLYNDAPRGEGDAVTFRVVGEMDGLVTETTVDVNAGGEEQADGRYLDPTATRVRLVFTDASGATVDAEDRTVSITVYVDGRVEFERTFLVDCRNEEPTPPTAEPRSECAEDGGVVAFDLDNPSDEAVDFNITIDGEVADVVTVPAGTATTVTFPVTDGTHMVGVDALGAELVDSSLTVECLPSPSVDATSACFAEVSTIEVELVNPDPTPATFVVSVDGQVVDTVEVADGTAPVSVPVRPGAYDLLVTADGETVLDEVMNVTCQPQVFADATAEVVCAPDGGRLVVTVDNPADATTAQLSVDGELVADVDVPSLSLTEVVAPALPDGTYDVVAVVGGITLVNETVDVDCVEVQGVTERPDGAVDGDGPDTVVAGAEELPNAGAESIAWVLFALLLVLFGSDLVLTELKTRLRRATR